MNSFDVSHIYCFKKGMLAAESIYKNLTEEFDNSRLLELKDYEKSVRDSWVMKELYEARNIKPGFRDGLVRGMGNSAFSLLLNGSEPWTLRDKHISANQTLPKDQCKKFEYEKPDGVLTFDILTNLQRTYAISLSEYCIFFFVSVLRNTYHDENEPSHLKIKPQLKHIAETVSYETYGGPESRFCPAKVYEFVQKNGKMELVINSQNCIHCKTCSIKTPQEYIEVCCFVFTMFISNFQLLCVFVYFIYQISGLFHKAVVDLNMKACN